MLLRFGVTRYGFYESFFFPFILVEFRGVVGILWNYASCFLGILVLGHMALDIRKKLILYFTVFCRNLENYGIKTL